MRDISQAAAKSSKAKKGATNQDTAIDTVGLALLMGATFVARSFSGDKKQLTPLVKAALAHQGRRLVPCLQPLAARLVQCVKLFIGFLELRRSPGSD